jgi:hypothetical protein
MNVEVEIYMSNILKFFRENPNELLNLIPNSKKDEFFEKVRQMAILNIDKGDEVSLTRKQLIEVCLDINGETKVHYENTSKVMVDTIFGGYCLN